MILTHPDRDALVRLLKSSPHPGAGNARAQLNDVIAGADVVDPALVPPTVVTMNSIVALIDTENGEIDRWALVYPADANVDRLKISVLTPLGVALIGRREGEIIEIAVPAGTRRFYLQKVEFQPESRFRSASTPEPAAQPPVHGAKMPAPGAQTPAHGAQTHPS